MLHDYLSANRDEPAIRRARRVDILTLGSPLTHLYQHYFAKYADTSTAPTALNTRITSWTNLWRVDDPIGNRIDMFGGTVVRNAPLRPGGTSITGRIATSFRPSSPCLKSGPFKSAAQRETSSGHPKARGSLLALALPRRRR